MSMPIVSNSTNVRISMTSAPIRSLNGPNIATFDEVQHQMNSHPAHPAPNALDGIQEELLCQWISPVKGLFSLPMGPLIPISATQGLNRGGNDAAISKAWVDRFIKHLPEDLKPPKLRSVKKERIDASNQETTSFAKI